MLTLLCLTTIPGQEYFLSSLSISLAHLLINRALAPNFTVLYKFGTLTPWMKWSWQNFPPVCGLSALLLVSFVMEKVLHFKWFLWLILKDIVELLDYYCLLTASLTRPRSWSICPCFIVKSCVIARHSLAPQKRRESKSVKSPNQRFRGLKGPTIFCNCQEFNLVAAWDILTI